MRRASVRQAQIAEPWANEHRGAGFTVFIYLYFIYRIYVFILCYILIFPLDLNQYNGLEVHVYGLKFQYK